MRLHEVSDRAVRRINMAPFERLFTDDFRRLIKAIEYYGFKVRIVGGAVRDVLIGRTPRDIDLSSDALPDQIMYILEKHEFPYVTKGIPHGTVKVHFSDEEEYEITSLAFTIEDECCPGKLVMHTSESWESDAKRRDFTIDAISVDLDGHLYDYVDGIHDLRTQMVRFISDDPETVIKKDPVLILRFFKLLAIFRNPTFDKSVIPILRENMSLVKRLKPKRLAAELSNIARGPSADEVFRMMKNLGAAEFIPGIPMGKTIHESRNRRALYFAASAGEALDFLRAGVITPYSQLTNSGGFLTESSLRNASAHGDVVFVIDRTMLEKIVKNKNDSSPSFINESANEYKESATIFATSSIPLAGTLMGIWLSDQNLAHTKDRNSNAALQQIMALPSFRGIAPR